MTTIACPPFPPGAEMTTAEARVLAVELVQRADAAEGYEGPHGFVTRMDLLLRVRILEERQAELGVLLAQSLEDL